MLATRRTQMSIQATDAAVVLLKCIKKFPDELVFFASVSRKTVRKMVSGNE